MQSAGAKTKCSKIVLNPRALDIVWGGNNRYWDYVKDQQSECAMLKSVCWLEVSGRVDLDKLIPSTDYQIKFSVRLNENASGWDKDVIFKARVGYNVARTTRCKLIKNKQFYEVPNELTFKTPKKSSGGRLSFGMYEIEGQAWKSGLLIEKITISQVNPA
ncbi:hypothetical protein AMTR_s00032p00090150 [Amborella trichopoda]|uniref:Uncharacterized protein n=1 Tax=Amborella trichopoda TaxID=13333 RepID=U5D364_AMBTC|nr:hypothetical protein AMTR_s00032p00090150 [Amborella trichopoda]